eukprot:859095_1
MAQASEPTIRSLDNHLLSLLKVNGNGWNASLFQDQNVVNTSLCGNCKDVCRDAVELGCDHDDDDIILFCNSCLKNLISTNGNKCPINQHLDPIVFPVRSARRQVLKTSVICPYSIQYKNRNKNTNIENDVVMDTIGGDQKEGIAASEDINIDGCEWKGTLSELLNSDHLHQCTMKYDATFIQKLQIETMQTENQSLHKIIEQQKQTIDEQSVIIRDLQNTSKTNKAEYVTLLQEKEKKVKESQDAVETLNAFMQKQSMQLKEAQKRIEMLENEKQLFEKKEDDKDKTKVDVGGCLYDDDDTELREALRLSMHENDGANVVDELLTEQDPDEFDPKLTGSGLTLTDNNTVFNNKNVPKYSGYRTCYGKRVVSSMVKNKTYVWKLKNVGETTNGMIIGIDNATARWKESYYYYDQNRLDKASYAFLCEFLSIHCWNAENKNIVKRKEKRAMTFKNYCDIITMKLEFGSQPDIGGILSYKVNDSEEYIACSSVARDDGLAYRLAISTNGIDKTASLKLLQLSENKENEHEIDEQETDEFDPNLTGVELTLTDKNTVLNNKNQSFGGGYSSSYGKRVISSMVQNTTYIWKFQNVGETTDGVIIGIDNATAKWKDSHYYYSDDRLEKASYAFLCKYLSFHCWNEAEKNIVKYKEKRAMAFNTYGDVIAMKLKFGSEPDVGGILSYKVNDNEEYIASSNVARE